MTADQVGQLHRAILSGFNEGELKKLVFLHLQRDLSHIVCSGGTFSDIVFELIKWAQRNGHVPDLIHGVQTARPQNAEIQTAMLEILASVSAGSEPPAGPATPAAHPLHQFPRGSLVPYDLIPPFIIDVYANAFMTPDAIISTINDAIRLRKAADRADPRLKTIQLSRLPNPGQGGAYAFWTAAFIDACKQGPRMVAALFLSVPDEIFGQDTLAARDDILATLKTLG